MVDLYDAGKNQLKIYLINMMMLLKKLKMKLKTIQENLINLIEKEDAGTALTSKEKKYKKYL